MIPRAELGKPERKMAFEAVGYQRIRSLNRHEDKILERSYSLRSIIRSNML